MCSLNTADQADVLTDFILTAHISTKRPFSGITGLHSEHNN